MSEQGGGPGPTDRDFNPQGPIGRRLKRANQEAMAHMHGEPAEPEGERVEQAKEPEYVQLGHIDALINRARQADWSRSKILAYLGDTPSVRRALNMPEGDSGDETGTPFPDESPAEGTIASKIKEAQKQEQLAREAAELKEKIDKLMEVREGDLKRAQERATLALEAAREAIKYQVPRSVLVEMYGSTRADAIIAARGKSIGKQAEVALGVAVQDVIEMLDKREQIADDIEASEGRYDRQGRLLKSGIGGELPIGAPGREQSAAASSTDAPAEEPVVTQEDKRHEDKIIKAGDIGPQTSARDEEPHDPTRHESEQQERERAVAVLREASGIARAEETLGRTFVEIVRGLEGASNREEVERQLQVLQDDLIYAGGVIERDVVSGGDLRAEVARVKEALGALGIEVRQTGTTQSGQEGVVRVTESGGRVIEYNSEVTLLHEAGHIALEQQLAGMGIDNPAAATLIGDIDERIVRLGTNATIQQYGDDATFWSQEGGDTSRQKGNHLVGNRAYITGDLNADLPLGLDTSSSGGRNAVDENGGQATEPPPPAGSAGGGRPPEGPPDGPPVPPVALGEPEGEDDAERQKSIDQITAKIDEQIVGIVDDVLNIGAVVEGANNILSRIPGATERVKSVVEGSAGSVEEYVDRKTLALLGLPPDDPRAPKVREYLLEQLRAKGLDIPGINSALQAARGELLEGHTLSDAGAKLREALAERTPQVQQEAAEAGLKPLEARVWELARSGKTVGQIGDLTGVGRSMAKLILARAEAKAGPARPEKPVTPEELAKMHQENVGPKVSGEQGSGEPSHPLTTEQLAGIQQLRDLERAGVLPAGTARHVEQEQLRGGGVVTASGQVDSERLAGLLTPDYPSLTPEVLRGTLGPLASMPETASAPSAPGEEKDGKKKDGDDKDDKDDKDDGPVTPPGPGGGPQGGGPGPGGTGGGQPAGGGPRGGPEGPGPRSDLEPTHGEELGVQRLRQLEQDGKVPKGATDMAVKALRAGVGIFNADGTINAEEWAILFAPHGTTAARVIEQLGPAARMPEPRPAPWWRRDLPFSEEEMALSPQERLKLAVPPDTLEEMLRLEYENGGKPDVLLAAFDRLSRRVAADPGRFEGMTAANLYQLLIDMAGWSGGPVEGDQSAHPRVARMPSEVAGHMPQVTSDQPFDRKKGSKTEQLVLPDDVGSETPRPTGPVGFVTPEAVAGEVEEPVYTAGERAFLKATAEDKKIVARIKEYLDKGNYIMADSLLKEIQGPEAFIEIFGMDGHGAMKGAINLSNKLAARAEKRVRINAATWTGMDRQEEKGERFRSPEAAEDAARRAAAHSVNSRLQLERPSGTVTDYGNGRTREEEQYLEEARSHFTDSERPSDEKLLEGYYKRKAEDFAYKEYSWVRKKVDDDARKRAKDNKRSNQMGNQFASGVGRAARGAAAVTAATVGEALGSFKGAVDASLSAGAEGQPKRPRVAPAAKVDSGPSVTQTSPPTGEANDNPEEDQEGTSEERQDSLEDKDAQKLEHTKKIGEEAQEQEESERHVRTTTKAAKLRRGAQSADGRYTWNGNNWVPNVGGAITDGSAAEGGEVDDTKSKKKGGFFSRLFRVGSRGDEVTDPASTNKEEYIDEGTYCPNCGAQLPPDANWCSNCSAPVSESAIRQAEEELTNAYHAKREAKTSSGKVTTKLQMPETTRLSPGTARLDEDEEEQK